MNNDSDNYGNNQISPIARMNCYGNAGTFMAYSFCGNELYNEAFYGGNNDYCSGYSFNTTSWD